MPLKVVYVAGPMRADNAYLRELNIRRAEEVALSIWTAGAVAICPHSQGRFYDESQCDWLAGDLEILSRCDAVYMVSGWNQSEGACQERARALELGKPVLYSYETFFEWLLKTSTT